MLTLLLPIAGVLLFLLFRPEKNGWRNALLSASITWGVILTAITELLSVLHSITLPGLSLGWLLVNGALVGLFLRSLRYRNSPPGHAESPKNLPSFQRLLLLLVCLIVLLIGVTAIVAPPNNWDSMTYHMARVAHWGQDGSVAHYPTSFTAQLYQGPWAEMAILNMQVLSGSDHFANLVQWFSMIGSVVAASLIAEHLGASLRGQVFAAILCATIPMGILQASSTQNDYVVSFWMICLIHSIWLSLKEPKKQLLILKASGSFGLAILTKGTAYIYSFPWLVWLSLVLIQQYRWRVWKPFLTLGLPAVLINFGHYLRNLDLFGNPIGLPTKANDVVKETNDVFNISALVSNVLRNLGPHAAGPFGLFNHLIEWLIRLAHRLLGLDINDPQTTSAGAEFSLNNLPNFEDTAPNPWHFLLILIAVILFFRVTSLRKQRDLLLYCLLLTASFLLFCLLLKWKPWNVRLHLFFFVAWMPFIGTVLSRIVDRIRHEKIIEYSLLSLLVMSLPLILYNESRPMLGEGNIFTTARTDQYFNLRSTLENPYREAVRQTNHCSSVGLFLREDSWEYPLWILLHSQNPAAQIQHILVDNISARKGNSSFYRNFVPCAVIAVGKKTGDRISIQNNSYLKKWQGSDFQETVAVFVPQPAGEKL